MKNFLTKSWIFCQKNLLLVLVGIAILSWIFPSFDSTGLSRKMYSKNSDQSWSENEMGSAPRMMMAAGGAMKMISDSIMPQAFADFEPEAEERKIVKNASLTLEVENTETTRESVKNLLENFDGFVTNLNSYEVRSGVLSYNFTIRIPSENLDAAIAKFVELGVKKNENFSVQDVTAQYVDIASRKENLETRRTRLLELMKTKTENLGDVLEIDRELASVQQQIENYERQLKRHDTNVAFSTLNLSLQPEPEIGDFSSPEWNVTYSWKSSVNSLIHSLQNIFDRAIRVLVFAPIWIPVVFALWQIQRWRRRKLAKKKK
ncbi:DUF4349 domain-containing protein [bacterium]|jgi:hypothetical protein|nr:DUF4349 domain-containing protein [bacterium]MBT6832048.1 DUF4349 domain-containing protein [bacterium]MBT6995829.1 DUF4349 domain-containing protein [bacterium]MBT7772360.1 DUF4349 domain-containing protein [bacterium]